MADPVLVTVDDGLHDLLEDVSGFSLREVVSVSDVVEELTAFAEFLDEVDAIVIFVSFV